MPAFQGKQSAPKKVCDRTIRFRCGFTNTIIDVLRARGWQEVRDDDFDIYWCDVGWMKEFFDHFYMEEHIKINHFRNHYELTRKNLMVKNLKRLRKTLEREGNKVEASKLDFFPSTYELPSEYHLFVEEFRRNPGMIWIMKPVARAQGKGIFLFRKLKDITDWKKGEYPANHDMAKDKENAPETYVVQRYLEKPYLIGGKKFDIRVYLLVTSYVPLRVWIYREGFARFSNSRFSMESLDDTYVHLTNVAIQKQAPDYDPEKGCKWSMMQLRTFLTAKHGQEAVFRMLQMMNDIFTYSLLSVAKIMINDKHCFELYGYDLLLDSNLKPWLIEVNASPALTASSQEDWILKFRLLDDVLNVVDMEGRLQGKEKRVGGFDALWNDGPVFADDDGDGCINKVKLHYSVNSFLGCYNDREAQLRQIYKGKKPRVKLTVMPNKVISNRMLSKTPEPDSATDTTTISEPASDTKLRPLEKRRNASAQKGKKRDPAQKPMSSTSLRYHSLSSAAGPKSPLPCSPQHVRTACSSGTSTDTSDSASSSSSTT